MNLDKMFLVKSLVFGLAIFGIQTILEIYLTEQSLLIRWDWLPFYPISFILLTGLGLTAYLESERRRRR